MADEAPGRPMPRRRCSSSAGSWPPSSAGSRARSLRCRARRRRSSSRSLAARTSGALRYAFELPEAPEQLAPGAECSLRTAGGAQRVMRVTRVTIERCEELRVTLAAEQPIDLAAAPHTLVVAPWFLYERLLQALDALSVERHAVLARADPVRQASAPPEPDRAARRSRRAEREPARGGAGVQRRRSGASSGARPALVRRRRWRT